MGRNKRGVGDGKLGRARRVPHKLRDETRSRTYSELVMVRRSLVEESFLCADFLLQAGVVCTRQTRRDQRAGSNSAKGTKKGLTLLSHLDVGGRLVLVREGVVVFVLGVDDLQETARDGVQRPREGEEGREWERTLCEALFSTFASFSWWAMAFSSACERCE